MEIHPIDKIRYFMRLKAKMLEEFFPGCGELYWNPKHEDSILSEVHSPQEVWNLTIQSILKTPGICKGLSGSMCPFCLNISINEAFLGLNHQNCCSECSYGKVYGICMNPESNYEKILSICDRRTLWGTFSYDWYKRVIELLEGRQL